PAADVSASAASLPALPALSAPAAAPAAGGAEPKPDGPAPRRRGWLFGSGKLFSLSRWVPRAQSFLPLNGQCPRVHELLAPLRDMWHQFRVLTARYIALIVGDSRGFRLLLMQAPIVALFLMIGFQGKNYQDSIPLRKPTDEEKALMLALKSSGGLWEAL